MKLLFCFLQLGHELGFKKKTALGKVGIVCIVDA